MVLGRWDSQTLISQWTVVCHFLCGNRVPKTCAVKTKPCETDNSNCLDVSTFRDSSQELAAAAACLAGTRRRALRDMRSLSLSGLFEANLIVLAFRDPAWWVVWLRRRAVEGQWFSWLKNWNPGSMAHTSGLWAPKYCRVVASHYLHC